MKKKYLLNNLNCAHCANKIENAISEFKEVNECLVNFSLAKMTVNYAEYSDEILEKIKKTINLYESDIVVEEIK